MGKRWAEAGAEEETAGAVAAPPRKFQFHGATLNPRQRAEMTHRVMKLCSIYAYSSKQHRQTD